MCKNELKNGSHRLDLEKIKTWGIFYFLQCVGTEVFLRSLLNIYSTTLIYQGFQPLKNVQKLKSVFEHFAHFSRSLARQGFEAPKNVQ
jgi:hypothetical protein